LSKQPLNGTQFRILLVLFRYTYGFNRKEHSLSETFLSKAIGAHKNQVQRELMELVKFKIITIIKEATFKEPNILQFNKNYDEWEVTKKLPVNGLDTQTGSGLGVSPGSGLATQERQLKDNTKDNRRFDQFWSAYPKKIGKGAAEKSFKKYKPSEELLKSMLAAIALQRSSEQWQKDGGQYIPNPSTWLNQKRWEDEPQKSVEQEPKITGYEGIKRL
jgi:phage replication O-like protein O